MDGHRDGANLSDSPVSDGADDYSVHLVHPRLHHVAAPFAVNGGHYSDVRFARVYGFVPHHCWVNDHFLAQVLCEGFDGVLHPVLDGIVQGEGAYRKDSWSILAAPAGLLRAGVFWSDAYRRGVCLDLDSAKKVFDCDLTWQTRDKVNKSATEYDSAYKNCAENTIFGTVQSNITAKTPKPYKIRVFFLISETKFRIFLLFHRNFSFTISLCSVMNIFKRFFYTLYRPVEWKRSSHENFEHWKGIKAGDVVEAAVEVPGTIRYRVEELNADIMQARVARLDTDGVTPLEHYTLSLKMIRPLRQ